MLLLAKGITKNFYLKQGFFNESTQEIAALSNIDFVVYKGETLGIVGESGSGKTTLARILGGIIAPSAGTLEFSGEIKNRRRDIQMVFQNPYESLDPLMTIEDSLKEPLRVWGEKDVKGKVLSALTRVGLQESLRTRLPCEFSGGQKQKIVIARALLPSPKLLVCDEPTSSLDVSVQAQIINLLMDLKEESGMSIIFISHNLKLVKIISDRILVLCSGIIVESGPAGVLMESPRHPYTQALFKDEAVAKNNTELVFKKKACPYYFQCRRSIEVCAKEVPPSRAVDKNHFVACFNPLVA